MANLLETGRPYLHMSAGTFVNNIAKEYKNDASKTRIIDTRLLQSLVNDAKHIEQQFYKDFGVNSALEWADKFLARENGSDLQVVLSIWNSSRFRNKLYGELEPDEIFNKVERLLDERAKKEVEEEFFHTGDIEKALTTFLQKNLFLLKDGKNSLGLTQKEFREAISGISKNKMRKLTTGSSVIPQLLKDIQFEENTNIRKKAEKCYLFLKLETKKKLPEKTDIELDALLKPFRETLLDKNNSLLLKGNKNDITGEVEEKGDAIVLRILLNEVQKNGEVFNIIEQGNKKVERVEVKQKVKSKIDMIIEGQGKKYRIQQKNTDKDIFREFENIGNQALQNHSLFFTAHSGVNFNTFRNQVEKIFGREISVPGSDISVNSEKQYLDLLEYILVNINALNKNYQSEERGGKLYKKTPPIGATGVYPRLAMKLLSDIASKYCLLFFSDITEEIQDLTKTNRYDFVIFNSRILIPMSEIYQSFIDNLTSVSNQVNKELTYLDVGTVLNSKNAFTQSDYEQMVEDKLTAVHPNGFIPSKNYSDKKLVTVGQNYGQNLLKEVKIGSFIPNVNLASLIPRHIF